MAISNGMLDPGNVIVSCPYYIAGKSGALTVPAAGAAVACLKHFGRLDPLAGLVPAPLRITAVRLSFTVTSGAAAGVAFEAIKCAVTTQFDTAGTQKIPTNRKTTGYPQIAATETNLFVSNTAAITGGTVVAQGDAFHQLVVSPSTAALGAGQSIWVTSDLCPLTIEAGEGVVVNVVQQGSAVGIFHVCFDFLRQ